MAGTAQKLSNSVLSLMRGVAADVIMPRYKKLSEGDVNTKAHKGDLVTTADKDAERDLSEGLMSLFPEARVVGEEAAADNPALLSALDSEGAVWVIDPIDGTSNFVNGHDRFAVVVALVHGGETQGGWILDPVSNAAMYATRGKGAWVSHPNETPRKVAIPMPGPETLAEMTAGIHHRDFAHLKGKFARVIRHGSAAHDYWALAEGTMHVLCYRRLKPWDHAAGVLIHLEAGGYNRLLSGGTYNPSNRDQIELLCASSKTTWKRVQGLRTNNTK